MTPHHTHGGDTTEFELRHGGPPVDFSASLNPFGMPARVAAAAARAAAEAVSYPDPLCRGLTCALAERLGVPGEFVIFGNGAADVIFRLVLADRPGRALITAPTFSEYEAALSLARCEIEYHVLDGGNGFGVTAAILEQISDGTDVLFLCQPNNPTGRAIDRELLLRILDRCAETRTRLVMDECFRAFLLRPEEHSLMDKLTSHPRLFILDSFTKLYAMAGIRLGFGVSADAELVNRMRGAGPPWSVSTVAQAAGLAALGETEYVRESLDFIHREKARLLDGLAETGARVVGADANYVFFRHPDTRLRERLAKRGILIRDCANFRGLEAGHYRVAVRGSGDNSLLLAALREIRTGNA